MILSYFLLSFFLFELSKGDDLAASVDHTESNEPFFLDIPIKNVLNKTGDLGLVEPWASRYLAAVQEIRFGDALWARYHIFGDIINDIFEDTNVTVLDRIEEDAGEYKSMYQKSSTTPSLSNVNNLKDATHLEERATYGIKIHVNETSLYRHGEKGSHLIRQLLLESRPKGT
ncbi:hypothetical protein FSHL1_007075 [Fusarium sambucinum]